MFNKKVLKIFGFIKKFPYICITIGNDISSLNYKNNGWSIIHSPSGDIHDSFGLWLKINHESGIK